MSDRSADLTELLHRWRGGSADAENQLFESVYSDLRRLAQHLLKNEHERTTLQATELVDQLYLRLVAAKDRDWQNRQYFFALAARSMRRFLIDRARGKVRGQMIGLEKLEAVLPGTSEKLDQVLLLDRLLDRLAEHNPDWCTLVELKYFVGLTDEEAAGAMGVKLRSMQRMWRDARQWLFQRAGETVRSLARDEDDLLMSLVEDVLAHSKEKRASYLRQACGDNSTLCDGVRE